MSRRCSNCGLNRAVRFYSGPRSKTCLPCLKKRSARAAKNRRLLETYEITIDEFDAILAAQGGVCAICKKKHTVYDLDHDHAVAKVWGLRASVRGVLSKRCNRRLLPAATDSVEILQNAIEYLTHPPAQDVLK